MILVTGATGIIGQPLIELLREAGADVRAITRNPQTPAWTHLRGVGRRPRRRVHELTPATSTA